MTMFRSNLRAPLLRHMPVAAPSPAVITVQACPPAAAQPAAPPPPEPAMSAALAPFTPTSAWRSNLFTPGQLTSTGQVAMPNDTWSLLASGLGLVGTGLGAYHGYRRTGSVGWTIAWALLGGLFPIITIPVAFAQGFGRPEPAFRTARVSGR